MHSSTHSSMKATGNHPPSKNKTTMGETKKPYEETACSPLFNQSLQKIKATETKPESPNPIKLNRKTLSKSFSFCARKKQRHNHRAASSPRPLLAFLTEFRSARGNRGSKRELQCSFKDPENIVHWLSNGCPEDVVPHILAFAGPHTAASFSRVNKHWNKVMKEEETWRIMCEGLYKVR